MCPPILEPSRELAVVLLERGLAPASRDLAQLRMVQPRTCPSPVRRSAPSHRMWERLTAWGTESSIPYMYCKGMLR
jgi:hypothetical protein